MHRWLGLAAGAILVLLAVTGVLINHSPALGLDSANLRQTWLLSLYHSEAAVETRAYRVDRHWLGWANGTLALDGEPVAECFVQPRAPLPGGAFVPSVLTGLLPLERQFTSVPKVGDPAVEAVFLDPDPPDASSYRLPYGVVFLFTRPSTATAERLRERYDCPLDADTRLDFDPYEV